MVKPNGLAAEWLDALRDISTARLSLVLISKDVVKAEFSKSSKRFLNNVLGHTRSDSGPVQAGVLGKPHAQKQLFAELGT